MPARDRLRRNGFPAEPGCHRLFASREPGSSIGPSNQSRSRMQGAWLRYTRKPSPVGAGTHEERRPRARELGVTRNSFFFIVKGAASSANLSNNLIKFKKFSVKLQIIRGPGPARPLRGYALAATTPGPYAHVHRVGGLAHVCLICWMTCFSWLIYCSS